LHRKKARVSYDIRIFLKYIITRFRRRVRNTFSIGILQYDMHPRISHVITNPERVTDDPSIIRRAFHIQRACNMTQFIHKTGNVRIFFRGRALGMTCSVDSLHGGAQTIQGSPRSKFKSFPTNIDAELSEQGYAWDII